MPEMNSFLVILLSAGGAAFLTAVIAGIKSLNNSKLESEAALIRRLNDAAIQAQKEADRQRARADRLEKYAETMRVQKESALDRDARSKRRLIEAGLPPEEDE